MTSAEQTATVGVFDSNYSNETNNALVPLSERQYIVIDSQKAVVIPAVMFALGVLGNSLAIVFLLMYKYRSVRPHSPVTYSSAGMVPAQRSPNSRHNSIAEAVNYFQRRRSSTGFRNKCDVTLTTHKRRRKNKFGPFHTLVLGLITVDLLGNVCTSPLTLLLYSTNRTIKYTGGQALCQYSAFVMTYIGIVTMASLMTMAIERVLSIQFPYYYHRHITSRTAGLALLAILVGCAIFAALPVIGFGKIRSMFPHTWCFADWHAVDAEDKAFNFIYAISGILMISTTVICNITVVVGLMKMRRRIDSLPTRKRSMGKESQMIIQLIVMTCIYLICWLPLMIRILANQLTYEVDGNKDRIAIWLAAANPILDPWVYILLRRSVVKKVVKITKSLCFYESSNKIILVVGSASPEIPRNCKIPDTHAKKSDSGNHLLPPNTDDLLGSRTFVTGLRKSSAHTLGNFTEATFTASAESVYDNISNAVGVRSSSYDDVVVRLNYPRE